jgi:ATP-dependent RNA helicase DDX42
MRFEFPDRLMERIRRSDFIDPTPIQSAACPQILAGRDVIGIARTGSGKTAAFIWPIIYHCLKQLPLQDGDGPMAVILAPTRELSQQIYSEGKRFIKNYSKLHAGLCFGGGNMYDQGKELKRGCEILVATPGRLIDHVKKGNTSLSRVSILTIDEADRMFELGFETQVRSLANHIRPDKQCLLFSATFKKKIEHLAREILNDPIRISQGDAGQVNKDVTQTVHIMRQDDKIKWLLSNIVPLTSKGSVLVFVTRKSDSVLVYDECKKHGYKTKVIHGDMHQAERNDVITDFKKQRVSTLIATDVAARGLDISHIKTVVNYDAARNYDTHIHRIGRTGRAGNKGDAITLLNKEDYEYAALVVRSIESGKDEAPKEVIQLAMKDQKFRQTRGKDGQKTNYQDSDRCGLGSKSNDFEPIFIEYSAPTNYRSDVNQAPAKPALGEGAAHAKDLTASQIQSARSSIQTNKLAAMRNAYKSQFGRHFTAATTTAEHKPAVPYTDPNAPYASFSAAGSSGGSQSHHGQSSQSS